MKIVDKRNKRKEKQANDWQVGDVVCFWKDAEKSEKSYAIITHISQEDGYGLTNLNVSAGTEDVMFAATPSSVIDILIDRGFHFERVNAKLVIE
ncbi:hypothetical protein CBF61_00865, partial [Lactobacillus taiwanensis]|uniref:Uncharacterized protein n=2 Tax=Lactobacillus taiwanensis TaxID=508451 RepID=A0A256LKA0_9LACO|nr:hypothetical protein [Lactobacillus taiwanensis]OYR88982.1 hypothetical protein CBF53_01310 [Lactobacillus taiwanensis]OYR93037.1 hypothetical protein CBF70_01945 [Lactobacillus taiwanensis]OYR93595.1 hypothetical protein CBF59_01220 [Lactobacillus taiwanensis]OYR97187.1 hypothetical protein CBF58_01385 [Lactobacillus taiwanensis]OYR98108.1 hypothetical protein CBF51_00540 [Lactobacillus taiwanensis]